MNVNTHKLLLFSKRVTILGVIVVTAIWLLDFLFLPLAILWISPFFAIVATASSIGAYFAGTSSEEKRRAKKYTLITLAFYIILFGGGFLLLGGLVDGLFF